MFKKFKYNPEWKFDLEGNILLNGDIFKDDEISDLLTIFCGDVVKILRKKWLALWSHYELDVPQAHLEDVEYIRNRSKVLKFRCGYQMFFKRDIIYSNGYYYIPGFTRFAINEKGNVISIKTGKRLSEKIGPYGYPYVNLYDPDKSDWRSVSVHILMARVFVKNENIVKNIFVNHKDGNKLNYRPVNLEWVTSLENIRHSIQNDLRNDNFDCKVRNIITKEVLFFKSIGSFLKSIDYKKKTITLTVRKGSQLVPRLVNGKYEVKASDDMSDWYYNDTPVKEDNKNVTYQALRIDSCEIFESSTIQGLINLSGVTYDRIAFGLNRDVPKAINGWFFRIKTEKPWPDVFEQLRDNSPKRVLLRNIDTNVEKVFETKRQAIAFLNVDKKTLANRMISQKPLKGWIIKLL